MNPLLAKEIRLLLPAFLAALVLAVAPMCLLRTALEPAGIAVYFYGFGIAVLALSSFGREFGLKTFALILAQPFSRRRIWWTKVTVLTCAVAAAFGAWFLSCQAFGPLAFGDSPRETMIIAGVTTLVMLAGGLWTTILLRQVTSAFWFTMLIPAAILTAVTQSGGGNRVACAALGLYSVAGLWWAGRQFLKAQETAWTGGVVAFSKLQWRGDRSRITGRRRRPLAALIGKEMQLQQVVLAGMGGLFLLHLGVMASRKPDQNDLGSIIRIGLESVWLLWFPVPLLAGATSVADERKLGTMEALRCEPISSRVQYLIKMLFAVVVGGVLSPLLLWVADGIGASVGAGSSKSAFGAPFDPESLAVLLFSFVAISLIGFYASTLARNLMQALAIGVGTILVFAMPFLAVGNLPSVFGIPSWRWGLLKYIEWPALVATLLWLAYGNFRRFSEDWRLRLRNVLGLTAAIVLIPTVAVGAYHRVWEFLTPLEPPHGPARLTAANRPRIIGNGNALAVVLSDGTLWTDRIVYQSGKQVLGLGERECIRFGGKWVSLTGSHFSEGSNWLSVAPGFLETVATRADGTLWVSAQPLSFADRSTAKRTLDQLVQFGGETNWQAAVCDNSWRSVLLLKRDGTLWRWGTNHIDSHLRWPGLRAFVPYRLGTDSDWSEIVAASGSIYAWKRDGEAWVLRPERTADGGRRELEPGRVMERRADFDKKKWKCLAQASPFQAGVLEDGTLWFWQFVGSFRALILHGQEDQLGHDSNWVAVASYGFGFAALKADGSLWKWDVIYSQTQLQWDPSENPVRLGIHNDWLALGSLSGGVVSLAADGSLWFWSDAYYSDDQPLLGPSRRPAKVADLFGKNE